MTLNFERPPGIPVNTLIGLNESGKTTILEALSHFVTGDNAVSSLFDGVHSKSEISTLIPVNKKAAFTGEISIIAMIKAEDSDFEMASKLARKKGVELNKDSFMTPFRVCRNYTFEDSTYKRNLNTWGIQIYTKTSRAKLYNAAMPAKNGEEPSLWDEIIGKLQETLPRVAYFPTFLVDMPKKIYLAEHTGETSINRYYRYVFQDILDSLNESLSLEKHVVARIQFFQESDGSQNWLSALLGGTSRSPIDSVFTKISSAVTKEVLGSWQKVFQRKISAKSINVEWGIDSEKKNLPYATISIFDGESRYYISERSLGFRWFFSFLLFTAFKQKSKHHTLFVFDEPAANLHAKAQTELLKSFSRTVANGDRIIYSTHSHHMIEPKWISGAYIIENTALDYDSDEDTFGLNSKPTNIIAMPYRNFVAQNPTRTSYFQPVIDMLEYVTPALIGNPPFVVVEGITDYYAFKLVERIRGLKLAYSIIPGVGAGASDPLISLLMGRGESFVLLLDDDKAGREAAHRYRTEWFFSESQAFTLAALSNDLSGKRLEHLLSAETLEHISSHIGISSKPSKKQIGLFFAEMNASSASAELISQETADRIEALLVKLNGMIA